MEVMLQVEKCPETTGEKVEAGKKAVCRADREMKKIPVIWSHPGEMHRLTLRLLRIQRTE